MSVELNPCLIEVFRRKVNGGACLRKYRNVDGKNKWNVICSAMDWISVAAYGLPKIQLDVGGIGPNHYQSLNLMQYIIAIDNMVVSVRQLYRVLYAMKNHPLSSDKSVFQQSKVTDDVYFKQIRAVFATHPVDLKSIDGIQQVTDERFYASWVASGVGRNDFTVFLYSNDPDKTEAIPFGVSIKKVNHYAKLRYDLLQELSDKVDEL